MLKPGGNPARQPEWKTPRQTGSTSVWQPASGRAAQFAVVWSPSRALQMSAALLGREAAVTATSLGSQAASQLRASQMTKTASQLRASDCCSRARGARPGANSTPLTARAAFACAGAGARGMAGNVDAMPKPDLRKYAASLGVATRKEGTKQWRQVADVRADCKLREAAQQQHSPARAGGPGSASSSQATPSSSSTGAPAQAVQQKQALAHAGGQALPARPRRRRRLRAERLRRRPRRRQGWAQGTWKV